MTKQKKASKVIIFFFTNPTFAHSPVRFPAVAGLAITRRDSQVGSANLEMIMNMMRPVIVVMIMMRIIRIMIMMRSVIVMMMVVNMSENVKVAEN